MNSTRVALVTGAARGIGAATVAALAEEGWAVVALDRCDDDPRLKYSLATEAELHDVVATVGHPDRVVAVVADTCDPHATMEAVALAEARFGGLDAIVSAAGVIAGGMPLWEMPEQEMEAVIDVNLRGALLAARLGVAALLRRPAPRNGRYVAVASAAAIRGLPMLAAYCAAKAGIVGLVRALAVELGATGVTANAVAPGSTKTPILDESARLYGLESAEAFAIQQPIGRLIEPREVAMAIAWLLRPESGAITGATISVDGGLSL